MNVNYNIELRTNKNETFRIIGSLYEITKKIKTEDIGNTFQIYEQFWKDGTLYFYTNDAFSNKTRFISITPLVY